MFFYARSKCPVAVILGINIDTGKNNYFKWTIFLFCNIFNVLGKVKIIRLIHKEKKAFTQQKIWIYLNLTRNEQSNLKKIQSAGFDSKKLELNQSKTKLVMYFDQVRVISRVVIQIATLLQGISKKLSNRAFIWLLQHKYH